MPLGNGETFAGFRIMRLLGSGGMGEVYLAEHPRLPRRDALKILSSAVSADTVFRERFTREADIAAALSHPHIVGVHDRGEFEGQLWISMEYVDGTDAARLVHDRYPAGMPPDEAVEIITAVAGALDYAHQQGLLHRDFKPANLLLTRPDDEGKRRVFLADFGIARELADPGGLTATNITVGTVAYAAPEQLMGLELDGRADQYALAATAFHLLTGAPPYQHSNPVAIIGQHLNAAIPKLSDRRPDLAGFDHAVSIALAKNPDRRFSSCRDFAKALREHVAAAPVGEHTTQAAATAAAPVDARRRPGISVRAFVLALIAVALVGVVTTVALLFTGLRGNPPAGPPNTVGPSAAAPLAPAPPTSQPPPVVAAPPLDGTYRLDNYNSKETINGQPSPGPDGPSTWMGFRSACTSAGCVATGTALDSKNLQAPTTDAINYVLHWINGRWQSDDRIYQGDCFKVGDTPGEVYPTEIETLSLEPQPDGTYGGTTRWIIQTNECGTRGNVYVVPFVAWRTGPAPLGVVADPPTTTQPTTTQPTTSAPRLSLPGTDGHGFVESYARCDPANPPALMAQTTKSLVVVCQAGPGNYYYRGVRVSDGAGIELANAVRTSGGFDVTNPADGTRYQVRPNVLNIISPGGHVDSEPMVQYVSS
jgi:serine/threonine protein kinase, bacterial